MSTIPSIDPAVPPLGKRGAFEGVARRHGRRRNPARMTPRSSLRTPTNPALHSPQRWVEKADRSIKGSDTPQHPWAADHYAAARARGHDHPRAIRTLGRAWSRVLWQCWQHRTPYDPARHRSLQQHVLVTIPGTSGPRPDLAATQRMLGDTVTRQGGPQGRARSA